MALNQFTCRLEKSVDDAIDKVAIKEKITKNKAVNKLMQLGLDAYVQSENPQTSEGNLSPKIDDIQKSIHELSLRVKDVDLKSFRMNIFLTEFSKQMIEDGKTFDALYDSTMKQFNAYKAQLKHTPRLGFIVLKYYKEILNKSLPNQFYDEVNRVCSDLINEDNERR